MRAALVILCALILQASLTARAQAAQVCAWIIESVEDDGTHMFDLNLGADAPASVSVRFAGDGFITGAMGGRLIDLQPGETQNVAGEGFDVSPGDDVGFDVQLFDRPLASLEEARRPATAPLAHFVFHRKVGEGERAPPTELAARQCKPLG